MLKPNPIAVLAIVRYPAWAIPFAIFSMAIFRLPLWLSNNISFYKLMGSGRNGSFDKRPDLGQWALLAVSNAQAANNSLQMAASIEQIAQNLLPIFIRKYWKFFQCKIKIFVLQPIEGRGLWDGKKVFGELPKTTDHEGKIAVLTRATIRMSKLKNFWKNVDAVGQQMNGADGFITSFGIGEIPFIKQATFSLWESKNQMKNFAYKMHQHADVIKKTRQENWYSEEMFIRFIVLQEIEMKY